MRTKTVLIIAEFEHAARMLEKQCKAVFESALHFSSTTVQNFDDVTMSPDAIVMNVSTFYNFIREKGITNVELFDLKYTLSRNGYERLLKIKDCINAYVFNINDIGTADTIDLLYELGINNILLKPLTAGTDLDPSKDIIITPNEESRLPIPFKNVVNIGDRQIDPLSLFNLAKKMNVLNEEVADRIYKCLQNSIPKIPGLMNSRLKANIDNSYDLNKLNTGIIKYAQGQIIFVNKKAISTFGKKEQDLMGERPEKILECDDISVSHNFVKNFNGHHYYVQVHVGRGDHKAGIIEISDEEEINRFNLMLSRVNAKDAKRTKYEFSNIIGENETIKKVISLAKIYSQNDLNLLIEGESGTGKEMFAQSIHNASRRAKYPFIAFNCAALQEDLAESELFGYEAGSFTGASRGGKIGLVEAANGGTLFLDEIGELSFAVQSKLLRMIQEQEVLKVGGIEPISVDIRVIAATNKNLLDMADAGNFRNDLYYRISTLYLKIPPLRDRQGDVELIISRILGEQKRAFLFSENLRKKINSYSWPGNIRELRNFLNYLVSIYQSELPDNEKNQYAEHFFYRNEKNSHETDDSMHPPDINVCDLDLKVMMVIYEKTMLHSTIGRNGIYFQLKDQVSDLSETSLRKCLSSLEKKGYIEKGKGRAGSRLNQKGILFVESYLETLKKQN